MHPIRVPIIQGLFILDGSELPKGAGAFLWSSFWTLLRMFWAVGLLLLMIEVLDDLIYQTPKGIGMMGSILIRSCRMTYARQVVLLARQVGTDLEGLVGICLFQGSTVELVRTFRSSLSPGAREEP